MLERAGLRARSRARRLDGKEPWWRVSGHDVFWVESGFIFHLKSAERMEQTTFCKMGWGPPDFFQMDLLGRDYSSVDFQRRAPFPCLVHNWFIPVEKGPGARPRVSRECQVPPRNCLLRSLSEGRAEDIMAAQYVQM